MKRKITYKNNLLLSYVDIGDRQGNPVLVQHGLIASINDYDLFNRLIQGGARLIAIARPGYGESSPYLLGSYAEWADLVADLIDELHLQQFDVLGISSGAPYGYSIGYKFTEQVRNIFILSGMPALYDDVTRSYWPYDLIRDMSMTNLEDLAQQWFFSNLTEKDLERNDIRDSLMNHGYGVAQDLRLRFMDWGFQLSNVKPRVLMRHSREDDAIPFRAAVRTSELLPDCHLDLLETGPHFSLEVLDKFIEEIILPNLAA